MAIPDFQTLMRPVLGLILNKEMHRRDCADEIARIYGLTEEETAERYPTSGVLIFLDRVSFVLLHLVRAGLAERPHRGYAVATQRGQEVYANCPNRIDMKVLSQFAEYREFVRRSSTSSHKTPSAGETDVSGDTEADNGIAGETPLERIGQAYDEMNANLRSDLIESILKSSPAFFERLILDLMIALGYGDRGAEQRLGRSGDGGIDGLVRQDPLGLNAIYLQAKRYTDSVVGVGQIREFADALNEREDMAKGVFVTTSSFAKPARERAERSTKRLVLIDGEELARLLIKYNVGVVQDGEPLYVKKVDENYFSE